MLYCHVDYLLRQHLERQVAVSRKETPSHLKGFANSYPNRPFMSTELRSADGGVYPLDAIFVNGVLDTNALAKHGIPRLTGTFAWAMFIANAAIGALILHCILFWGKDIWNTYKMARKHQYADRHHVVMEKNYKECPWHWYAGVLVISFILGLIVCLKEDIHLPVSPEQPDPPEPLRTTETVC